jgi:hypothetical protein
MMKDAFIVSMIDSSSTRPHRSIRLGKLRLFATGPCSTTLNRSVTRLFKRGRPVDWLNGGAAEFEGPS